MTDVHIKPYKRKERKFGGLDYVIMGMVLFAVAVILYEGAPEIEKEIWQYIPQADAQISPPTVWQILQQGQIKNNIIGDTHKLIQFDHTNEYATCDNDANDDGIVLGIKATPTTTPTKISERRVGQWECQTVALSDRSDDFVKTFGMEFPRGIRTAWYNWPVGGATQATQIVNSGNAAIGPPPFENKTPIFLDSIEATGNSEIIFGFWDGWKTGNASKRTFGLFNFDTFQNGWHNRIYDISEILDVPANTQVNFRNTDFLKFNNTKYVMAYPTTLNAWRISTADISTQTSFTNNRIGTINNMTGTLETVGLSPVALANTNGTHILAAQSTASNNVGKAGIFLHSFDLKSGIKHKNTWYIHINGTSSAGTNAKYLNLLHIEKDVYVLEYVTANNKAYHHMFGFVPGQYAPGKSYYAHSGGFAAGDLVKANNANTKDYITMYNLNNAMYIQYMRTNFTPDYTQNLPPPSGSKDTTAPTITAPPDINKISMHGHPYVIWDLGQPTVSDNKTPVDQIVISNDNNFTAFSVGAHTITWTATDLDNNNATDTQTVTITYQQPPPIVKKETFGNYNFTTTVGAPVNPVLPTGRHNQTTIDLQIDDNRPGDISKRHDIGCKFESQNKPIHHEAIHWSNTTDTPEGFAWGADQYSHNAPVHITCYEDNNQIFHTTVYPQWDPIQAFGVIDDAFGTDGLFGVPWIMLIILMVSAMWTGKSSQVGVIVTAAVIALMVAMGFLTLSIEAWAMVILLAAAGMFLGKKLL